MTYHAIALGLRMSDSGGLSDDATGGLILIALMQIQQQLRAIGESADALPKRYLTVANAAAYCDLSEESIRRLISSRKLTAHRPVRGRVLVDRQELDAVIRNSTTMPRNGRGRTSHY